MMRVAKLMGLLVLSSFFMMTSLYAEEMAQNAAIKRLVLQLEGPVLQRDETPARKPLSLDQAMKSSVVCMQRRLDDQMHLTRPSFLQSFLRLFGFGSKPYSLQRQGTRRVLIEFQGTVDAKAFGKALTEQAKLSFHQVKTDLPDGGLAPLSAIDLQRNPRGFARRLPPVAPPGHKILADGSGPPGYIVIKKEPVLTGLDIVDAQPAFHDLTREPILTFHFSEQGGRIFGSFTKENINKPFAIVLDGKLVSAPIIREQILGGSGQISGDFSLTEVVELARQLRTCPLAGEFTILSVH